MTVRPAEFRRCCAPPQAVSVSIRDTERLAEAGVEPTVGDSCDTALAETINGLVKTESLPRT